MTDQADESTAPGLELAGYLMDISERERAALARTLHDEFGSNLTAINLDLASVAMQLPEGVARKRLERAMSVLKETVELKRRLIQTLRPGMIDTLGLAATLRIEAEGFASRAGLRCTLALCEDPAALEVEAAMALYRVLQSRFEHLAQGAAATRLALALNTDDAFVTLVVEDDGAGACMEESDTLARQALRAQMLRFGGSLDVVALAPGCRVEARVPLGTPPRRA